MQLVDRFRALAKRCATSADVPVAAGCCGFAGDRGFTLPQLTEAATLSEATEVRSKAYVGFFSSSRTCEIGLTRATGRPYRSFWTLLEQTSRHAQAD
jgi:D-lactate dehydrogenase